MKQLQAWVERGDWNTILPGYSRCVRITRDQKQTFKVDPKIFVGDDEKKLYKTLSVHPSSFDDVDEFLNVVLKLIPVINEFFENVLVMDDDKALKENRLGLPRKKGACRGV